jgi:hypothetical protein
MVVLIAVLLNFGNLFGLLGSEKGEIGPVRLDCQPDMICIECSVSELDEEFLRQILESGEILELTYQIEHQADRKMWFDVNLGEYRIQKILSFDPLSRQYFARRLAVDQPTEEKILPLFADALGWLTTLQTCIPRFHDPDLEGRQYIRLRVVQQKSKVLLLIPREMSTPWKKVTVDCP